MCRAFTHAVLIVLGISSLAAGQSTLPAQVARPIESPPIPQAIDEKGPTLLHLPGVSGYLGCDRHLLAGLADGGFDGNVAMYDWTDNDPGLRALHAYDRNRQEATRVSQMILKHHQIDSTDPFFITAHSGGCAIAIWALEQLPAEVRVDTVILVAPAISPDYDLSAALKHVRGNVFAFTSINDVVALEAGTKLFGTMDGVRTVAAGFSGFIMPQSADADLYKKLIQEPYQSNWLKFDNDGDHIGAMSRKFAAAIIAPLLLSHDLVASTHPSK